MRAGTSPSRPTSSWASRAKRKQTSRKRSACWTKYNTIHCSASSIHGGPIPALWHSRTIFPRSKRAGGLRSFKSGSELFRSGGIPSWLEPSKRRSWKVIIMPRANGSVGLLRIALSTSFIRSRRARKKEQRWLAFIATFGLLGQARIRWPERPSVESNNKGGPYGSRNENPRVDDGPCHQHADCGAEGHRREHHLADLGGDLRGQCHRPRDRKSFDAASHDSRPDQDPPAWSGNWNPQSRGQGIKR